MKLYKTFHPLPAEKRRLSNRFHRARRQTVSSRDQAAMRSAAAGKRSFLLSEISFSLSCSAVPQGAQHPSGLRRPRPCATRIRARLVLMKIRGARLHGCAGAGDCYWTVREAIKQRRRPLSRWLPWCSWSLSSGSPGMPAIVLRLARQSHRTGQIRSRSSPMPHCRRRS